jgi:arylsulfatase A-like enzyme
MKSNILCMVANLDHNMGRIPQHLRERKLEDNTIVLFMNDNGKTHGLDVFNAGMRGSKCTIWQGGSRAISFWRWPGCWQPHAVPNLTAHLDVIPTLCDLAGVTLAASHKYAMASVRSGDHLLVRSHPCDDPACESFSNQCTTLRSVEKGATRATYTADNAQFHWGVTPRGRWSLYNLKTDADCSKDLASQEPELTAKLTAAYEQWWNSVYPEMIRLGGDKGDPGTKP